MSCIYNYHNQTFTSKEELYIHLVAETVKHLENFTIPAKLLEDIASGALDFNDKQLTKKLIDAGISSQYASWIAALTKRSDYIKAIANPTDAIENTTPTTFIQPEFDFDERPEIAEDSELHLVETEDGVTIQGLSATGELVTVPLFNVRQNIVNTNQNLYVHNIFPNIEAQQYTFRVLANTFVRIINKVNIKLIDVEEGVNDVKTQMLDALYNAIFDEYGEHSDYMKNFITLENALKEKDSPLWISFKAHLNRYHGYKITDLNDAKDEEGMLKKSWDANYQFSVDKKTTIASEIKDLFNTSYKIVKYKVKDTDTNIDNKFEKENLDKTTWLGMPDSLQWMDYASMMLKLMADATTKEQMLERLRIMSSINKPKAKALYNIYLKLKPKLNDDGSLNEELLETWYSQFAQQHPIAILDLVQSNNNVIIHNSVISNRSTIVEFNVTDRWVKEFIGKVIDYTNSTEKNKEKHKVQAFLNEYDSLVQIINSGVFGTSITAINKFYAKLAKHLNNIGIDISAAELEYVTYKDGSPNGLKGSLLLPMGKLQQFIVNYKGDNNFESYNDLKQLALAIKLFRMDEADTSSVNANNEIEQSSFNPNFISDRIKELKNPETRVSALLKLARIPQLQHSNWLWHEPNRSNIVSGMLKYSLDDKGKRIPVFKDNKLQYNEDFVNNFDIVLYKGVKDTINNKVDEYDTFDDNARMQSDILSFFNNPRMQFTGLGLYTMRCNSDSTWTYKIYNAITDLPTAVIDFVKSDKVKEDAHTIFGTRIFKAFLNVYKQDVDEINQALALMFETNAQGLVYENGKLKIKETLDLSILDEGYHFKDKDKNGNPIILDKYGKPTGRVFKMKNLRLADGTFIQDEILALSDWNKVYTSDFTSIEIKRINTFIAQVMHETVQLGLAEFNKIKDNLLTVKSKANVNIFTEDNFEAKIATFLLNDYISNVEQGLWWEGTLSEFNTSKNDNTGYTYLDYLKRSSASTKFVQRANPSIVVNGQVRTGWKTLIVNDLEIEDILLNNKIDTVYEDLIKRKVITKDDTFNAKHLIGKVNFNTLTSAEAFVYSEIKAYKKMTLSDGISIITYNEFKNRMKAFGLIGKYKALFDKIDNGQPINSTDHSLLIESQKEFYYHRVHNATNNTFKSRLVKDSKYILIPGYEPSDQLTDLHEFMMRHGIDEVQFQSGNKIQSGQSVNIFDKKNQLKKFTTDELNHIKSRIQESHYKYLGIQQSIHSIELDSNNKLGVQIMKIIWDNISPKAIYTLNGKKITGTELFAKFGKLFSSQIRESVNQMIVEFGGKLETINGELNYVYSDEMISLTELTTYILTQAVKQGLDNNILYGLQIGENGRTNVPLSGNIHRKKILSILESVITNRIIRQVHPGPHAVLVSNAFMNDSRKYVKGSKLANKKIKFIKRIQDAIDRGERTSSLQAETLSSNGEIIIKAEVVLSPWTKYIVKDGKLLVDINDLSEDVRTMIAYRIPYEDKHSTIYLEVVGFIESGANQIYVPDEIVPRSGTDFDIDTEYLMAYNLYANSKGEIKVLKYIEDDATKQSDIYIEQWIAYKRSMFHKYGDVIPNNISEALKDKYNEFHMLLDTNITYDGDPEIKKLAFTRRKLFKQLNAERANKVPNKALIKDLKNKINIINPQIEASSEFKEYVQASKNKKLGLTTVNEQLNTLHEEIEQALINAKLLPTFNEFKTLSEEDRNTYEAKQNKMLDTMIAVISNPEHLYELRKSNVFEEIQISKEQIDNKLTLHNVEININNYTSKLKTTKSLLQTVSLKGNAVAFKSLISMLSKLDTRLSTSEDNNLGVKWKYKFSELAIPISDIIAKYGETNVQVNDFTQEVTITHLFVGNTLLNDGRNMANSQISSYLAQVVSNILDSVKFPMSYNLNGITLNLYSILPTLGVSHRITHTADENTFVNDNPFIGGDSFIHQPIILELVNKIKQTNSNTYTGSEKNKELYVIRNKYLSKLITLYNDNSKFANLSNEEGKVIDNVLHSIAGGKNIYLSDEENVPVLKKVLGFDWTEIPILSLSELTSALTDFNENTATEEQLKYQLLLLNNWTQLDKIKKALFEAIQILRQDKKEFSIADHNNVTNKINYKSNDLSLYNVVDGKAVSIYENIYENNAYPILSSIYDYAYTAANRMISPLLISESNIVQTYLNKFFEQHKIYRPDVKEKITDYLVNHILTRLPILAEIDEKEIKDRILSLGETNDLDSNMSLDEFITLNLDDKIAWYKENYANVIEINGNNNILNKITIKNKSEDIARHGYVRLEYMSDTNNNEALDSVNRIYNSNDFGKALVEDIIRYSFLTEGLTYGFNLSKTIPYTILKNYGYSELLYNVQKYLVDAQNEIDGKLTMYQLLSDPSKIQVLELENHYNDAAIRALFFENSNIINDEHFMEMIYKTNFYNNNLIPILRMSEHMEEINGAYIIGNDQIVKKNGYYSNYLTNTYVRIKSNNIRNLLQMNNNHDLFDKLELLEFGEEFDLNIHSHIQGKLSFKNVNLNDFFEGNIVAIRSPYNRNQDSRYVNLEIIDATNPKAVRVRKTSSSAAMIESLYKQLYVDDGRGRGVTMYYPIERMLPSEYGRTSIQAFKPIYNEEFYREDLMGYVLEKRKVNTKVMEHYNKIITNDNKPLQSAPLTSQSNEPVVVSNYEKAIAEALINHKVLVKTLLNKFRALDGDIITDENEATDENVAVHILTNLTKGYATLDITALAALARPTLLQGLKHTLAAATGFANTFEVTKLRRMIDNSGDDVVAYWAKIQEGGKEYNDLMTLLFSIKQFVEGYNQFTSLIEPYLPDLLAEMSEEDRVVAQQINDTIKKLSDLKGAIEKLNNTRHAAFERYANIEFRSISHNPEVTSDMINTIKNELANIFDGAYDDIGVIRLYLDSPLAVGNTIAALVIKKFLLNEHKRKRHSVELLEKFESALDNWFAVTKFTTQGMKDFSAQKDDRAKAFFNTFIDKDSGRLITEFKHTFLTDLWSMKNALQMSLEEEQHNGGKQSPNYILKEKEYHKWLRDNLSQRWTDEYLDAKESIQEILNANPNAKIFIENINDKINAITLGNRDRTDLTEEQKDMLKDYQSDIRKAASMYNEFGAFKEDSELELAKVLSAWQEARTEFYTRYHTEPTTESFDKELKLAKKIGGETLERFLANNTELRINKEFYTKQKELFEILYGIESNPELETISKTISDFKKSYPKGDYPIAVQTKLHELEQRKRDIINDDRDERLVKFTSIKNDTIYTPEWYELLRDAGLSSYLDKNIISQIDTRIKEANKIIMTVVDEYGHRNSEKLTLDQLKQLHDLLKDIKDLNSLADQGDTHESIFTLFETVYDMDAYNTSRKEVMDKKDPQLLAAWDKIFTRTVYDKEYQQKLDGLLKRIAKTNKLQQSKLDNKKKEIRDIKTYHYDVNGIVNGLTWNQNDPNDLSEVLRVKELEELDVTYIRFTPLITERVKYTKEFYDNVNSIKRAYETEINTERKEQLGKYLEESKSIKMQINEIYSVYSDNVEGRYDATDIAYDDLLALKELMKKLETLRNKYDIPKDTEQTAWIKANTRSIFHSTEYAQANRAVIEKHGKDSDYYKAWVDVNSTLDYATYHDTLNDMLYDIIKEELRNKAIALSLDPNTVTDEQIQKVVKANRIDLSPEGKAVYKKYGGYEKMDYNTLTDKERVAVDTFIRYDANNKPHKFTSTGLIATVDDDIVYKDVISEYVEKWSIAHAKVKSANTTYVFRDNYIAKLKELAQHNRVFQDVLNAIFDYEKTFDNNALETNIYYYGSIIFDDATISNEDKAWFMQVHRITNTGEGALPRGYYMKSVPRTGTYFTPNSFIWHEFTPINDKYIDKAAQELNDIMQTTVTEYYQQAKAASKLLPKDKQREWFNNNHIWNEFTQQYVPISIWTKRTPRPTANGDGTYNTHITTVPNKQFYGYGKLDLTHPEARRLHHKYKDKAKTDARKELNDLSETKTTPLYEYIKNTMKNGDPKLYNEWFARNHIVDAISGKIIPLSIWTKSIPKDESYITTNAPLYHWNESEVKDEYKNKNFREDRRGNALPQDHYKDARWDSVKDDKFYNSLIETIAEVMGTNRRTIDETGLLPIIPDYEKTTKQSLSDYFGLTQESNTDEVEIAGQITHILRAPFMQELIKEKNLELPIRGKFEDFFVYKKRVIAFFKEHNIVALDGKEFTTFAEIIKDRQARRDANLKETIEHKQYDPYTLMKSFINEGLTYKYRKHFERELLLYDEAIEKLDITRRNKKGRTIKSYAGKILNSSYQAATDNENASNIHTVIRQFIKTNFYDITQERTNAESIAKVAMVMTSLNYMGLNFSAGFANLTVSEQFILQEAAARTHIEFKDWRLAKASYAHSIVDMIANSKVDTNTTLDGAIMKKLDIMDVYDEKGSVVSSATKNTLDRILGASSSVMYFFMNSTEHIVQNTMALAMHTSHRIVNGKIKSFYEYKGESKERMIYPLMSEAQKANLAQFKKEYIIKHQPKSDTYIDYLGEWLRRNQGKENYNEIMDKYIAENKNEDTKLKAEFETFPTVKDSMVLINGRAKFKEESDAINKEYDDFKIKIKRVNQMMFGVYDKIGANMIQTTWGVWGNMAMQFRKWLRENWNRAWGASFGKTEFDEFKRVYNSPVYVAWVKFVGDPIKRNNPFNNKDTTILSAMFNILHDYVKFIGNVRYYYNTLTELEKANIRKVNVQMGVILTSILAVAALVRLKDDEDEDENYLAWLGIYQAFRLYSDSLELTPFGWLGASQKMLKSPFASVKALTDMGTFAYNTLAFPFRDEEERLYQSGANAGRDRLLTSAIKVTPLRSLFNMQQVPTLVNYYKMYTPFDLNTKSKE